MSQGLPPSPQPDPHRLSLESLEQQLRALPPPVVPEALPNKLVAAIPHAAVSASLATSVARVRLWIAGFAVAGILLSAAAVVWLTSRNSHAPPEPNASPSATSSSAATGPSATTSSKTIQTYEQAVRFDPYNADAWFNLAKAQAEVHRTDEALSSAQKALDIARSRNQTALVETIEAWLRSSPDIHPGRSPK